MNRRSFLKALSAVPGLGFMANWGEPPRDKFIETTEPVTVLPFNNGILARMAEDMIREMDRQIIAKLHDEANRQLMDAIENEVDCPTRKP